MLTTSHPSERTVTVMRQIPLVALALFAVYVRITFLQQFGPDVSPDSANYFSTAANLLAGKGFVLYDGNPFVMQGPLYPMLLAAMQVLFGLKQFAAAPILNSAMFGAIVYLGGTLFFRHLRSPVLAFVGTISLFFSFPLFENTINALSEATFIALLVLFLLLFELYQEAPRLWVLALAGVVVSLGVLTRYIGAILIPVGIICIWFFTQGSRRERLRAIILFTGSSLVFCGVWLIRNFILSGQLFGGRGSSPQATFEQITRLYFDVIFSWYASNTSSATPIAFVIVGAAAGLIIGYAWRDNWQTLRENFRAHGDLVIFILCYTAIVIYQDATTTLNPLDHRLLSPLVIPLHILILVFLENLVHKLVPASAFQFATCILALAVLWWMPYPQSTLKERSDLYRKAQGLGWHTSYWNAHPTIEYLRRNPLECKLYSNGPDILWVQAEIPAKMITANERARVKNESFCVVLFDGMKRGYTLGLEDLQKTAYVVPIAAFKGGTIYSVSPK